MAGDTDRTADTRGRVVIADDDVLLREGVASLLDRAGFDIAGQAGDAEQLIALVREQQPDLAIVDIRMPPTHSTEGLDAARTIREEGRRPRSSSCRRTSTWNTRWTCSRAATAAATC
jgi:DNA-binding NarL/FixJ family response regulator